MMRMSIILVLLVLAMTFVGCSSKTQSFDSAKEYSKNFNKGTVLERQEL